MAQQQQKGNPIFGEKYLQNRSQFPDVAMEYDTVAIQHAGDIEKLNQQSGQDVSRNLGNGGSGPIVAINAVIRKAEELSGKPDGITEDAAKTITPVLEKLVKAVQEQLKQDTEAAAEKKKGTQTHGRSGLIRSNKETQWTLPDPESPTVKSWDEFLEDMPTRARQQRERHIIGLSDEDRAAIEARLSLGITKKELGQLLSSRTTNKEKP